MPALNLMAVRALPWAVMLRPFGAKAKPESSRLSQKHEFSSPQVLSVELFGNYFLKKGITELAANKLRLSLQRHCLSLLASRALQSGVVAKLIAISTTPL
jgi:hypothetical protein